LSNLCALTLLLKNKTRVLNWLSCFNFANFKKSIYFILNLEMLKSKSRFFLMGVVGVTIFFIFHKLVNHINAEHNKLWDLIACILITMAVWEGNIYIDNYLNKIVPWQKSVKKRIAIQAPMSISYTTITIFISLFLFNKIVCQYPQKQQDEFRTIALIIGLMTSIIILTIDISSQFLANWKKSLTEIEKHKTKTSQVQLQNLKNQINPHFLFNNLSVLSSLVYNDQDKAVDFINQLSKVYRYILENRESELATIESEMTFINSYIFLLQIRFDKNIQFNIEIDSEKKQCLIPPMSLQLLIENAIKHNEISTDHPLTITIKTKNEQIEISNNLQLRTNQEPSSKTGIQNIIDRYTYFTKREIEIIQDEKSFIVKIPILKEK